jgi:hypothetical protein
MTTQDAFDKIITSEVFRRDGEAIDLPAALIDLVSAIRAEDETDWSIGEFTEASLDCLIIGAYWSLSEWHGGQWSPEYAALCALGTVFSPGMTNPPEEDEPEFTAYELCGQWFAARHPETATA